MNIFVLHEDPTIAARMHCDKHVNKMILEYAQMMSSAHRLLDGVAHDEIRVNKKGNEYRIARWAHPERHMDDALYVATHWNHPCSVWVRESAGNYVWMYYLWHELCVEWRRRYGHDRDHLTFTKLSTVLTAIPRGIKLSQQTPWPLAMDDEYKVGDVVQSYRNFYIHSKSRFAKWSNNTMPTWYKEVMTYAY